jgi:hypothetical protein
MHWSPSMNTPALPHTIALHRGLGTALADQFADGWQRLQSAWKAHRARRAAEDAEREMLALDPRALQDIGAPEGLVGQRRWEEEAREARAAERLLDLRGW